VRARCRRRSVGAQLAVCDSRLDDLECQGGVAAIQVEQRVSVEGRVRADLGEYQAADAEVLDEHRDVPVDQEAQPVLGASDGAQPRFDVVNEGLVEVRHDAQEQVALAVEVGIDGSLDDSGRCRHLRN
jgi:hypothetical protein